MNVCDVHVLDGSDDSGTNTAGEGSSTDIANESEALH